SKHRDMLEQTIGSLNQLLSQEVARDRPGKKDYDHRKQETNSRHRLAVPLGAPGVGENGVDRSREPDKNPERCSDGQGNEQSRQKISLEEPQQCLARGHGCPYCSPASGPAQNGSAPCRDLSRRKSNQGGATTTLSMRRVVPTNAASASTAGR